MSDKILVKFKEAGKWADNPADPVFEVDADEVVEVSANLANIVVDAKKGKIVKKKPIEKTEEDKDPNDGDEPKEGDKCTLDNGKEGVIKNGECVKKGLLG